MYGPEWQWQSGAGQITLQQESPVLAGTVDQAISAAHMSRNLAGPAGSDLMSG